MRPLSARNPRIARLARLARRPGERAEQRALLVEGPVLLGTAIDAGVHVEELYVDESAADNPAVLEAVARLDGPEPWVVPAGVLDRIGDVSTSQGTIAVVSWEPAPGPVPARTSFVVVLAGVADPGNAGTLIRAAFASGAGAVVLAGGVDPSNPKVVRASAGAIFAGPVAVGADPVTAGEELRAGGYRLVGAVAHDGRPYDDVDLSGPIAVVLGNEAHGIAADLDAILDERVTIPLAGPVESLNVAMAGTVLCFEVLRQRRGNASRSLGGA